MQITAALLLLAAVDALQINHIFRRPTPFLNEKNTFTEDDGYKLLEGHREKRFSVAWARDLLRPPKPGKLVLVRHGESTWNRNATFTGWTDVDLSERGERDKHRKTLSQNGYGAKCYLTSVTFAQTHHRQKTKDWGGAGEKGSPPIRGTPTHLAGIRENFPVGVHV